MLRVAHHETHDHEATIVVSGDTSEEVLSPEARKLAYAHRTKIGFDSAGIENCLGTGCAYADDLKTHQADKDWLSLAMRDYEAKPGRDSDTKRVFFSFFKLNRSPI